MRSFGETPDQGQFARELDNGKSIFYPLGLRVAGKELACKTLLVGGN
jgi:hypothetical protein